MNFWVGVTDKSWFDFLAAQAPEEVNFWRPSPKPLTRALAPGIPFLFKLHAPNHFIVGGGFFVRHTVLPARLAWDAFGTANGAASYLDLRAALGKYGVPTTPGDPEIGCNILNAPFFLPPEAWIPAPSDWARNIVSGRTYNTSSIEGAHLWHEVQARLIATPARGELEVTDDLRGDHQYLVRAHLGQGTFRVLVTDAYHRRCAVTTERTLPVLEAAHIKSYASHGPNLVRNGVLLRADLHTLFDQGYLTISTDRRVLVSKQIKERFANGREYYKYEGQPLQVLPDRFDDQPAADFLAWHNERVYLG
jgi:putative restriction endonuclease